MHNHTHVMPSVCDLYRHTNILSAELVQEVSGERKVTIWCHFHIFTTHHLRLHIFLQWLDCESNHIDCPMLTCLSSWMRTFPFTSTDNVNLPSQDTGSDLFTHSELHQTATAVKHTSNCFMCCLQAERGCTWHWARAPWRATCAFFRRTRPCSRNTTSSECSRTLAISAHLWSWPARPLWTDANVCRLSLPGMHWSAATTTWHCSSRWCQAWSSFASTSSWSVPAPWSSPQIYMEKMHAFKFRIHLRV